VSAAASPRPRRCGHGSSKVSGTVYRHQLKPAMTTGAEKMDALLGAAGQCTCSLDDTGPDTGGVSRASIQPALLDTTWLRTPNRAWADVSCCPGVASTERPVLL
jgi:hypothetical protein